MSCVVLEFRNSKWHSILLAATVAATGSRQRGSNYTSLVICISQPLLLSRKICHFAIAYATSSLAHALPTRATTNVPNEYIVQCSFGSSLLQVANSIKHQVHDVKFRHMFEYLCPFTCSPASWYVMDIADRARMYASAMFTVLIFDRS